MRHAVTVLVVDPDRASADRTAAALAGADDRIVVTTADGVTAAVDALEDDSYDGVVTETEFPDGSLSDVVAVARTSLADLPVLVFTDAPSAATADDALVAGADGYLEKASTDAEALAERLLGLAEDRHGGFDLDSELRTFAERTSDGIFTIDDDWQYTYVNRAGADMVDRQRKALIGNEVWSVFPDLEDSPFGDVLETAMHDREAASVEAVYPPHGSIYDVRTYPSGSGISVYFRDVTDRHRQIHTLRRLHDIAGELYAVTDARHACELCVDAMDDVLGHPLNGIWLADGEALEPVAVAGTDRIDVEPPVFDPGDSLAWEAFEAGSSRVYGDVRDETEVYNPETPLRSEMFVPVGKHGLIIVSSVDTEAFDEQDLTVVELIAYHLEVTLDRIAHERQLERERDRFHAAFDSVPEPAVHVLLDSGEPVVNQVNAAFEAVFGHDEADAIGASLDELIVPTGEGDAAAELNRAVREERRFEAEIVRETEDGPRPFLFTGQVMQSPADDNGPTGAVATYVDLSDQKQREAELERQNRRLEQFTDVLSHDIPNHLSVAAGHLELARETGTADHFDRVATAHDRIETLLRDMQELVRTGTPIERVEPVQLSAVARSCWRSCCAEDDPASLEIVGDSRLRADRTRLTQLLENLFWNACDHAGDDVAVRIGPLDDGFYVEDDGPGISPDEHDDVFEAGYTTSPSGTGFGLAIVGEIATAHGWSVTIESSDSGGARFVFTGVDMLD